MKLGLTTVACLSILILAGYAGADPKHSGSGMAGHKTMKMDSGKTDSGKTDSGKMGSGTHQSGKQHDHKGGMKNAGKADCTAPVKIGDDAERKPGGSLYEGPLPKEATRRRSLGATRVASAKPSMSAKSMKEMEGAHLMHKGQRGGELIMVPNQLHHLEIVYSTECGYQLFFYNAFTEPIRADRFHAFVLVLPEDGDDFFELLRFLTPSADGSHLSSRLFADGDKRKPRGIFETELYIKFPESLQPMRFDPIVGTEVTWK